ncbi:MAG: adenylosuccinate lyase [Candidatus Marinimicrobia bacterium]|nr:adenylosuccinate lyase [Candidatus Neomarinimicrobiota bacterium]
MPHRNIDTSFSTLSAISPLDGRYRKTVHELGLFFSEEALIKYRLKVEIEYVIALSLETKIVELKPLSSVNQRTLRGLYTQFDRDGAKRVKEIENTTNHDVKAVEYYLQELLKEEKLNRLIPWVHFALTSEDVNNLAYSLMWQDAIQFIYLPGLKKLNKTLRALSHTYADNSMLSLTHGQPATPTTLGKEFAVFVSRIKRQKDALEKHNLLGKLGGATGTWSAHSISLPHVNWQKFSKDFVTHLGLAYNPVTTQIESHDALVESYHTVTRINGILLDMSKDIWMYISRGILGQKKVEGEIGSSTMPHKVNPIRFENAEGNLGLSTAILGHLAGKLQVSRMQRDLSDSTAIRNQGVGLGYAFVAIKNIMKGLDRLTVNETTMLAELDNHWEVLGEAVQTILRKAQKEDAYEQLKVLTRGQTMSKETMHTFIEGLDISEKDKMRLLKLTPASYTGLANKIAKKV